MKISLKNKIWILSFLSTSLILLAVFFTVYNYFHFQWQRQIESDLLKEIHDIQKEGLRKIHGELEEGEYFFDIAKESIGPIKNGQFIETEVMDHELVVTQFELDGQPFIIGKSVDHYRESQERLLEIFLNISIIILSLVAILAYIFSRLATRSISKLSKEVQSIDFVHINPNQISVGKNPKDEVMMLQQTFQNTLIKLKKYHQEQKQFIDAASHEFRTPLTIIKTSLDLAEKHPQKLAEAKKEVENLTNLTSELLLITKLENAKPLINKENISKLTSDELKKWKKHLIEAHITPNIKKATNKDLFLTILRNLLDNAIKFSPNKSPIKVRLTNSSLTIENKYSKKVDLSKITKAFYQDDPYASEKGIGLGLHLVVKITKILDLKTNFYSNKGVFGVEIKF